MNDIIPSLGRSIFEPTYDIIIDAVDMELDNLLESDILKEIPVVKSIAALCKVGYNIRERHLIKQTCAFISGCNSGKITEDKLKKYREKLKSSPEKAEKELGRVMIILDTHIDDQQSKVLGGFYNAYVNGDISWDKFCELSEANRRMFLSDYIILIDADNNNGLDNEQHELYQVDRLISLGLLQNNNRLGAFTVEDIDQPKSNLREKDITITSFGKTFCEHMPRVRQKTRWS